MVNRKIILAGLMLWLLIGVYAFTTSTTTTTYYLVRHAEKACEDCGSCGLAAAGEARAATLATLLANKGIDRIYASECLRTQKTAQPLADKLGQSVNIYKTGDLKGFISRIKGSSHRNILIVGHSDQIPMIVKSIAHKRVYINSSDFDNLFIVSRNNTKISLESKTYGVLTN